jgi:antitoxin ParD1/3/4
MNLDLVPEIAAEIRRKVESGRYSSESDVVEAAIELLERRDVGLDALRSAVQAGQEELDRGEGISFSSADELLSVVKDRAGQLADQEREIG